MINIVDKSMCSGCSACVEKCPVSAIKLVFDNEGFLYPNVDEDLCLNCGLCDKVCHELEPYNERSPLAIYYAINKDETVRLNSSSGGLFSVFAEKIIDEGGVVFGATFDNQWNVIIDFVESKELLYLLRGSKYVQARIENSYINAERFLKNGRKVLFTGTPCQISGLHHFLNKEYDNLFTIEIVCHGVPSPMVWKKYLCEIIPLNSNSITRIQFRNKDNGWKKYSLKIDYKLNGELVSKIIPYQKSHYMRLFLSNISLRLSCYNCKAKCGRSHSDVSMGDMWGIEKFMPDLDDDKGASIVFVYTEKAYRYFDNLKMIYKEIDDFEFIKYNAGLRPIIIYNTKRDFFFKKVNGAITLVSLANLLCKVSFIKKLMFYLKDRIKHFLCIYL